MCTGECGVTMKVVLGLVVAAMGFSLLAAACGGGEDSTISQDEGPTISREKAIEIAASRLPEAIVARGDIKAELHGWYWEVVFDNLNAAYDELTPFPVKPGPSPPPGSTPPPPPPPGSYEKIEKIYQSVVVTIDAETGNLLRADAYEAPAPGPYVSEEQAIASAPGYIRAPGFISAPGSIPTLPLPDRAWLDAWLDGATVEAYLRGDTWVVLFYPEEVVERPSITAPRITVWIDAVTGRVKGAELKTNGTKTVFLNRLGSGSWS